MNADGSTLTSSYSTGNITIKKIKREKALTKAWAGGVAGIAGSKGVIISNCYSAGAVSYTHLDVYKRKTYGSS